MKNQDTLNEGLQTIWCEKTLVGLTRWSRDFIVAWREKDVDRINACSTKSCLLIIATDIDRVIAELRELQQEVSSLRADAIGLGENSPFRS